MKTAIELISDERQRQINVEGWTYEHDDRHRDDELAIAAACYTYPKYDTDHTIQIVMKFPWNNEWWKPCPDDRIRELVKAGALVVAEIERLQRKR